jgi:hypothetical protein
MRVWRSQNPGIFSQELAPDRADMFHEMLRRSGGDDACKKPGLIRNLEGVLPRR